MNKAGKKYLEHFNGTIRECEIFCSIARDSGLQRDAIAQLGKLIEELRGLKAKAVEAGDEDLANILLGCESVANCISAEIAMWLLLKEEKPDEAWDQLVTAQMAAADAARAHKGFEHLEAQAQRLHEVEQLVFPPQVFVSTGLIVRHQECSVCGKEYGECDHLAGKPYMGQFCSFIAKDIEPDHVALVKNPADKRCRIMQFRVDGGERNRMTWKVQPTQEETPSRSASNEPLKATARLLRSGQTQGMRRYK